MTSFNRQSVARPPGRTWRRGVTSVLAMLYLVLFGTLAIGFYAAPTTQSQLVANDERTAGALFASESGMDFMRYQLARVSIPPGTPNDVVVQRLYDDLRTQLEDTGNLGSASIVLSASHRCRQPFTDSYRKRFVDAKWPSFVKSELDAPGWMGMRGTP